MLLIAVVVLAYVLTRGPDQPPAAQVPNAQVEPARPVLAADNAKPPAQKSPYDTLEQEMASLFGRPNKP